MAFFIAPLAYLTTLPSTSQIMDVLKNDNLLKSITNTFIVSLAVGVLCVLIGVPLAWLLTRTNLPGKNRFRSWFCLPYAIPPYVGAIGWIILANPNSGVLNTLLGLKLNIYSFTGLVWVETSFLFTFVLLTTLTALDRMDSSLEEAARLSGARAWHVFRDISLPLLRPAIFNGFALSFLATAASFGVPAMIGGPARLYLMTTQIYTYQRMGTTQGIQMAVGVSVLLMITTLVLLLVVQNTLGQQTSHLVSGKSTRPSLLPLKGATVPVCIGLILFLFLIFILPLLGLLLSALSAVQGSWSWHNLGFGNFARVLLDTEETMRAIMNSLILGLSASVACALFSFFMSYFITKTTWRGRTLASVMTSIPFSTPGSVLALALILAFSQGYFGIGPSLYNTLGLILIAYIIKYMSLSLKTLHDGYSQIHPSLEEAARISGAGFWATLRTIYLPLLKSSLVASAFFVFMPVMSELTMTILLTGPGLETIGTLIFWFVKNICGLGLGLQAFQVYDIT
ncbi:MAG: iron ABC transporter permease [Bdellovibrionaceae bacterium]|nr:iron ABC transporter permease [Pseudobdellovibrionaceae bacterium]